MCLNFNLNQAFALALVREDAGALVHSLRAMPTLPESAAWANFIRNHDEWSLDKLTEAEAAGYEAGYVDGTAGEVIDADRKAGTAISTGRDLDVAIQGDAWLAVQAADGEEAYTRRGDLTIARSKAPEASA